MGWVPPSPGGPPPELERAGVAEQGAPEGGGRSVPIGGDVEFEAHGVPEGLDHPDVVDEPPRTVTSGWMPT